MRLALFALLACVVASVFAHTAFADIAAVGVGKNNGCTEYTLCSAETDTTAACDTVNATGAGNIVATVDARYASIACVGSSTATTIACNLYTSDNGYHATVKSAALSSTLTEANACEPIDGLLRDVWAECTTITGGSVTLTLLACPMGR